MVYERPTDCLCARPRCHAHDVSLCVRFDRRGPSCIKGTDHEHTTTRLETSGSPTPTCGSRCLVCRYLSLAFETKRSWTPTSVVFCTNGRRITPMRVAGLAFESVMRFVHLHGIWSLTNDIVRTVEFSAVSLDRADGPRCAATFLVADRYKEALLLAGEDVAVKLHESGFAIIGTIVDEPGSTQHDMVLDYRRRPRRAGKYSCELKVYSAPANYRSARARCFPLFEVACSRDPAWLGQVVVRITTMEA